MNANTEAKAEDKKVTDTNTTHSTQIITADENPTTVWQLLDRLLEAKTNLTNDHQQIQYNSTLVRSSKTFLEEQWVFIAIAVISWPHHIEISITRFLLFVDDTLSKHVLEAKIGGIPSVANRIRGYMNIALKRSGVWITPKLEVRFLTLCNCF